MNMKTKLNCVAMKHQGAEKIHEKIAKLAPAEELRFWQERSVALRKKQDEMKKKRKLREVNT